MDRQYKYRDIIEYLGVRYCVLDESDNGESWECINGHTFDICQIPKSKITKYIGKSNIDFIVLWIETYEGRQIENWN